MLYLDDLNYNLTATVDSVTEHDSDVVFNIHVIHKYPRSATKQESGYNTSTWNIVRSLEDFEESLRSVLLDHGMAKVDSLNDFSFEKSKKNVKNLVGSVISTI